MEHPEHHVNIGATLSLITPTLQRTYVACAASRNNALLQRNTMADSRGVRPASRRKTPTPQPLSRGMAPQLERVSRTRSLRSASREADNFADIQKPTRRGARQATVTTVTEESESEALPTRRTKRQPTKETLGG